MPTFDITEKRQRIYFFSCSTNIDRKPASISSRSGVTVQDDCVPLLYSWVIKCNVSSPRTPCEILICLQLWLPATFWNSEQPCPLATQFIQSGLSKGYQIS